MRLFNQIGRCAKILNFHRQYVNGTKSIGHPAKVVALNVIGSGAPGEEASVCLSTSNEEKYLFNCGESCQRLLFDQKEKISEISNIFITQNKWNCIGGIGCISAIINKTNGWLPMFHGPAELYKCIKRILCLSILGELDFKPIHCNSNLFFEDDILRIDFISITPNAEKKRDQLLRDTNEVMAFICEVKTQAEEHDAQHNNQVPAHFMGMFAINTKIRF